MYPNWFDKIGQAPLVPVAVFAAAGLVVDRYLKITIELWILLALASLLLWCFAFGQHQLRIALLGLWLAVASIAGIYHHFWRFTPDNGPFQALLDDGPRIQRLRGFVLEAPEMRTAQQNDPLSTFAPEVLVRANVKITEVMDNGIWRPILGRIQMIGPHDTPGIHSGDFIEIVGQLTPLRPPSNPGEMDWQNQLRDRRIQALFKISHTGQALTILEKGDSWQITRWRDDVRQWGQEVIATYLPEQQQSLARALLLGEQSAIEPEQWQLFQRTGVIHVLAISGQHLMVVTALLVFLGCLLRRSGREMAMVIPLFVLCYAFLTGGRAPIVRAALMVTSYFGATILTRMVLPPNCFALAFLLVSAFDPTAIFQPGCQLSFLSVAVLLWGTNWLRKNSNEVELLEEDRPLWRKLVSSIGLQLFYIYGITFVIWVALAPLVAARYHLVVPIGLIVGPPMLLLTSFCLLTGTLMLLASLVFWPLAWCFGQLTAGGFFVITELLSLSEKIPGSYWYVSGVHEWWMAIFYAGLLAGMILPYLRCRWPLVGIGLLGWLCFGLFWESLPNRTQEVRVTFLAVGHGSCVVIELPDGRNLLYDAGALSGPEVTRRQIAPYLWARKISRIDEVFLSHADLDHFNGLPDLLEHFSVRQITSTPSFFRREMPGITHTQNLLQSRGIPIRSIHAGMRIKAGDLGMQVLHPPSLGPSGPENVRSMTLLLHHGDNSILLTGDLEKNGMKMVLQLPATPVDVLMAPHHGSHLANTAELADWARPRIVVSCQGKPKTLSDFDLPYQERNIPFLSTWQEGAVTIRSDGRRLIVETFLTKQKWFIR